MSDFAVFAVMCRSSLYKVQILNSVEVLVLPLSGSLVLLLVFSLIARFTLSFYWSFLIFLATLSQRLIGELIVYPWSTVRPSVRRRPQCSKIFFSETAGPIKAKFYVNPPWVGGTKVCSCHLGHMTKMAATPIYDKNPSKIFFSGFPRNLVCSIGDSCPS